MSAKTATTSELAAVRDELVYVLTERLETGRPPCYSGVGFDTAGRLVLTLPSEAVVFVATS